jgi:hypothetical protein
MMCTSSILNWQRLIELSLDRIVETAGNGQLLPFEVAAENSRERAFASAHRIAVAVDAR